MKKLLLTLLILLNCFTVSAQQQETMFIPLAIEMNNSVPSHLLPDTATPYAENVLFDDGFIRKRFGITTVTTTAGAIKGYHNATDNYALLMAHNGQTWGESPPPGVIAYEWDKSVSVTYNPAAFVNLNLTHLDSRQTPTFYSFAVDGGCNPDLTPALFSPTETFNYVNHFDPVVGAVTIFTNGVDCLHKYIHESQPYPEIYPSASERKIDFLYDPTSITQTWVKGKYLQSYYDSVYLSNITSDGYKPTEATTKVTFPTETGISDPFETFWSDQLDATDWSVTQNHQPRTEEGTVITGLKVFKDILFVLKNDQIWAVEPYDNFQRISQTIGSTNNYGAVSADTLYLNDKGRIVDVNDTFISKKIHDSLASRDPGTWDIRAVYNKYNNELLFSTSNYIFKYKITEQTWETYRYSEKIQILDVSEPGRPFSQWIGTLGQHSVLTIHEEDIIADFIAIYGDTQKKLVVMNHFADDDGNSIKAVYETRQESAGDTTNKKRWQVFTLQGSLDLDTAYATRATVDVYGWFGDSPVKRPTWQSLGTIKFDDNGYGELQISEGSQSRRTKWCAFRLEEDSTYPLTISKAGIKFTKSTYR